MFLLGVAENVEPDALTVALCDIFEARIRNGDTAWGHIRMILIGALLALDESALHIELPMDVPSVDAICYYRMMKMTLSVRHTDCRMSGCGAPYGGGLGSFSSPYSRAFLRAIAAGFGLFASIGPTFRGKRCGRAHGIGADERRKGRTPSGRPPSFSSVFVQDKWCNFAKGGGMRRGGQRGKPTHRPF